MTSAVSVAWARITVPTPIRQPGATDAVGCTIVAYRVGGRSSRRVMAAAGTIVAGVADADHHGRVAERRQRLGRAE